MWKFFLYSLLKTLIWIMSDRKRARRKTRRSVGVALFLARLVASLCDIGKCDWQEGNGKLFGYLDAIREANRVYGGVA